MGTQYQATVSLKVWKQHKCVGCESLFRYPFTRKVVATASNEEQAMSTAKSQLIQKLKSEVDQKPCPQCSIYQPEMIATRRGESLGCVIALAIVGIIVLFGIEAWRWVSPGATVWVAAGLSALLLLWQYKALRNPNEDLTVNKLLADEKLLNGELFLDEAGPRTEPSVTPGDERASPIYRKSFFLLAIATVLIPLCDYASMVGGWPANERWYPTYVGPGDTARYDVTRDISSMKGYWNGDPLVEILNAADLGLKDNGLPAQSNDDDWGTYIEYEDGEESDTEDLWIDVEFPSDAELAGKTLKLKLDMAVTYPYIAAAGFDNGLEEISDKSELVLASPGAGGLYILLWWVGFFGGLGTFLIVSFGIARMSGTLKKRGNPSEIYTIDPEPGAEAEPEPEPEA